MPSNSSGSEIRKTFIDFFKEKGHTFVPSSSLVPGGDQTLLFTNAGMVQFKDVFLGVDKRPYTRAVNSQKCMRVAGKHNDLEDVGRDDTHHTFFEMLGNWSFGDYDKEEAITWAWELLTDVWGLDRSKLWVTVFEDEKGEIPSDEEAAEVWRQQPGLIKDHVVFLGRKENFWEMADSGPCGPCSEIHIELGEDACPQKNDPNHVCDLRNNCKRFLEFWNLVFIQYNRLSPTELVPLPNKHVDTGMGLERIVSILQGKQSNYATDLFLPLMDIVMQLANQTEALRKTNLTPYRVIADHSRAAAFLIADGVVPGNIGRNYICRMIIRRASRFGGKLGLDEPFLAKIAGKVIESYGEAYPELEKNRKAILDNITREEVRFHSTLEIGLAHLQDELDELKKKQQNTLNGKAAFDLYATHGLPFEIARDVAREQGMDVEENGFHQSMEEHRLNSGAGKVFGPLGGENSELYSNLLTELVNKEKLPDREINYDPYSRLSVKSHIASLLIGDKVVEKTVAGNIVEVILPETCFYIESGGQVSDTGLIYSADGNPWEIRIDDVQKPAAGIIVHVGEVIEGSPRVGDKVIAQVNAERRRDIMRNHTATHLLHAQLRKVLGDHVRQAGSLVAPDKLRFDFTHPDALSPEELDRVEVGVNQKILANYPLQVEVKNLSQATQEGAIALFGEKYGENVRTITIGGEERISYELCAGTHVDHTGDVGTFIILSESSAAAGIRRIEAVTGTRAYEKIHAQMKLLHQISSKLSTSVESSYEKIIALICENEKKSKDIEKFQEDLADYEYENNKNCDLQVIGNSTVFVTKIGNVGAESLRKIADKFRSQYKSGMIALGANDPVTNRPIILIAITEDMVKSKGLNAVDLVKSAGELIGGGGGGKPTLAQAGGSDSSKISVALEKIKEIVKSKL